MGSSKGDKRMKVVARDFNSAINIKRYAMLTTRSEVLTRSHFVEQPLRLEICMDKH